MTIKVGDRMPEGNFKTPTAEGPAQISGKDYFSGSKVALFGLPGAFTPPCAGNHLPGYLANAAALKAKGVDKIACLAVNDVFVLKAWSDSANAGGVVDFLSDGNADYVTALGLERDMSAAGFGTRSGRFSMIVEDGVVKQLNVEESPGDVTVSSAETLLGQL